MVDGKDVNAYNCNCKRTLAISLLSTVFIIGTATWTYIRTKNKNEFYRGVVSSNEKLQERYNLAEKINLMKKLYLDKKKQ